MLIVLGVVVLGLVWWFVLRPSTQRRRPARPPERQAGRHVRRSRSPSRRLVLGPPVADAVIEMIGVSKSYGRGERRRLALDSLDLTVPSR